MADDASDTFSGGFFNFLVTLGFILPLLGGEEIIRSLVTTGPTLPLWFDLTLIAAGLPLHQAKAIWKRLRGGKSQIEALPLQYLSNESAGLGPAIRDMAWLSAWGRWYAAQCLANSPKQAADSREDHVMQMAASLVSQALVDGKLEARGRLPKHIDYETIPATHWYSSAIRMIRDNVALWKMSLLPTGGAEIDANGFVNARNQAAKERTEQPARYDSIIIRARQFESQWPLQNPRTDAARRKLLKQAKKAGADLAEIAKLSREYPSSKWRIKALVAAVFSALALLAFLYAEGWISRSSQSQPNRSVIVDARPDPAKPAPAEQPPKANPPRVIPLPNPAELPTAYSGLSNSELKAIVARLTGELRLFDASYQRRFETIKSSPRQGTTTAEQRSEAAERTKNIAELRAEENEKYKQFTEVRPLYFELLARLSKLPPPEVSPMPPPPTCVNCISPVLAIIYSPTVFGETTLDDLAVYLDSLAAIIPEGG